MKDLRDQLAAKGVHTLLAQFTDLHGVAKGRAVPLSHLDDLLADGLPLRAASIAGLGLSSRGSQPEYRLRGAASTASALPWLPGYARLVCDGWLDGAPHPACPRQVLRRQTARLAEHGWQLRVAAEPAFYLMRHDAQQGWRPALQAPGDAGPAASAASASLASPAASAAGGPSPAAHPAYDLRSLLRQRDFLLALQHAMQAGGLNPVQVDHEDGVGQFGLQLDFDDALASADQLMLLRLATHALAEARGLAATFCARPFDDQPGSGAHLQLALWQQRRNDQRNLFVPHRADGSVDGTQALSPLGRQFVAGVLAHAPGLCALAAPTVNSYRRLRPAPGDAARGWAPPAISHGVGNRSAMLRLLHGVVDWRLPDAGLNPYLVLAGLVAAGLDGIQRQLDPGPGTDADLLVLDAEGLRARGLALLPHSLGEALDALRADPVLTDALGPVLAEQHIELKTAEAADLAGRDLAAEQARYLDAV